MKFKKAFLLICIIICLFTIASACASEVDDTAIASEDAGQIDASQSEDVKVDILKASEEDSQASDDEDILGAADGAFDEKIGSAEEGNYSDLRSEIGSGGNVNLTKSYYRYASGDGVTIEITNSGVINGNGAVIDMAGSTIRAFKVRGSGVTIKNLTIKNANFDGDGGAIWMEYGNVTNCNFKDNKATNGGGAIYIKYSAIVLNCNFTGNSYSAIRMGSGSIENCKFTDNKALNTGGHGGAISMNSGNVTNCIFTNNYARDGCGAIRFISTGNVTNCNFTGNKVTYRGAGGAIGFDGSGSVINCNFKDNIATNGDGGAIYINRKGGEVTNCNFIGNKADYDGGAIAMGIDNVTNCNFTSNNGRNGGAICVLTNIAGNVTNCIFTYNEANDDGGAIYFTSSSNITNCNFTDNKAPNGDGSAIYFNRAGNVTICNFVNNTAYYGGAVCFSGNGNGTVTNCNFDNNFAWYGSAIKFGGNGTVTNCNFTKNNGSGAILFEGEGIVTICNFTNNTSSGGGGAIEIHFGSVKNCNFDGNIARTSYNGGGAILFWLDNAKVENCNFTNNQATSYQGGAVYFAGSAEVKNCNFTNNFAHYGGALHFDMGSHNSNVTNCNFTFNKARLGSAIYFESSSANNSISNSVFLNNRAVVDYTPFEVTQNGNDIEITFSGGNNILNAIYSDDDDVNVTNVTYWGANGISNTGNSTITPVRSNREAGQNITVIGVIDDNDFNTTKVTDDNGKIILENVLGDYLFSIRHDEDSYYTKAVKTTTNMQFYVNITSIKTTNKTVNVTAKSNIRNDITQGELEFYPPNSYGISANYNADGTWWALYTFSDYGDYAVTASYWGLSGVTINDGNISIRAPVGINVSVKTPLTYGGDAVITVELDQNITSIAILTVDGIDHYVAIVNGKGGFNASGLSSGNHEITAIYEWEYGRSENHTTFLMTNATLDANITALNVTVMQNTSFVVNVPDSFNGNVSIKVDDTVLYNGTAKTSIINAPNLSAGNKTAVVVFYGDSNYDEWTSNNVKFTVSRVIPEITVDIIDVYYPAKAVAVINVSNNANGTVNVTVDGKTFKGTVSNGVANVNLTGLSAGLKEAAVKFFTTDDYNNDAAASAKFTINKADPSVAVNVSSNIDYGADAAVGVSINDTATGDIAFYVDGVKYTETRSGFDITDLAAGKHSVMVSYAGDKNFTEYSSNFTVTVNKIAPVMNITDNETKYLEDALFTIKTDVPGYYTLFINNVEIKTVKIEDSITVSVPTTLVPGTYDVNVTVDESENHTKGMASATLTIGPVYREISLSVNNITYGESVSIVPGALEGATGTLDYTIKDVNGSVVKTGSQVIGEGFDVSDLDAGTYAVSAVYSGDALYTVTVNPTTFEVRKAVPDFDASASNVIYGTNITVVPTINVANGNINYTVKDSKGNVVVSSINDVSEIFTAKLAAGTYTVNATYLGNQNYTASSVIFNVTVNKANSTIVIDVERVYVYNDNIIINLTSTGSTGAVNVTINGKVYPVNADMQVVIESIATGEYTIIATLAGDENYTGNYNSTTFKVRQAATGVEISVESVHKVGDNVVITLNTVNATDLTVTVNGEVKPVDDNKVTITDAKAGAYIVYAVIKGNENYTGSDDTKSFSVVKNDIAVTLDDVGPIVVDSPVMFIVRLSENVTGDVIFTVNGANHTVHIDGKDVAVYEYTPVNNATIAVVATFAGNYKYNNASDKKQFDVDRIVTDVGVTVKVPVTYGEDAIVSIDLDAAIDAVVKLSVDGKVYDVALVNGKGKFNASGLTSGNHEVNVTYAGDDRDVGSVGSTTFTVDSANLTAKVTALNVTVEQNTSFVIDVTDKFNGNVSIEVDGAVLYNGTVKAMIDATRLLGGNKTAIVTFYGDNNYNVLTLDNVAFTVSKVTPTVNVGIDDVTYPNTAIAIITIDNVLQSIVRVTVDGKVYEGNVSDGLAVVELPGLSAGNKVAYVEFFSNDDYNNDATGSGKFNINKTDSTVLIDVEKVYVYRDLIIINLTAEGSSGAVNVTINGKVYPVNADMQIVIEEIDAGEYTIIADLTGNENYTGAINSTTFKVRQAATSVEISVESIHKVGDDLVITLNTVNQTDLTVTVNGEVKDIAGDNTITIPNAKAGDYIVNAIIKGNVNYIGSEDTKSFSVVKYNLTIGVNDTTDSAVIVAGSPVTFTANLNESVTGDVIFTINGANYTVHIEGNDVATYQYTPLNNATITVTATFAGNDRYNCAVSALEEFNVSKISTALSIELDKTCIITGDIAVVSIVLDPSISGVVTVRVGGKDYPVAVVDGKGSLTLSGLAKGNYTIDAVFAGDDKYMESNSNNLKLEVDEKTVTEMSVDINTGNGIATVELPDGVTGNVTVVIDGKVYNVTDITESPVTIGIGNLAPGNHTVELIYSGDDYFTPASDISDVEVPRVDDYVIGVTANVDGTSVDITVSLPIDIVGAVLIEVNGVGYYANATGGQAKLHLDDLPKGKSDVVVQYAGDAYYAPRENATSFTIEHVYLPAQVIAQNVTVEQNASFIIDVADEFNGKVLIRVDGNVMYDGDVKMLIEIAKLTEGNKTAELVFYGDINYDILTLDNIRFTVSRVNPAIGVTINDVTYPDDVIVLINVANNANGTVNVTVDGITLNKTVYNGVANITFTGLTPGNKLAYIEFFSDDEYNNNVSVGAKFSVNKLETELTAKEVTATYNINKDLVITLTDINGNPIDNAVVTVNLNGAKDYTTDKNGQVKVSTKGLAPKTYTATITYKGSTKYVKSFADVKVTVKKAKPKIVAKKKTYRAKAKTKKFTITLKDNRGKAIKNAKVTLKVTRIVKNVKKTKSSNKKKKLYTAKTNKKGKITFKIKKFKKGKYKAVVKFAGNAYYKKASKKVQIKLK